MQVQQRGWRGGPDGRAPVRQGLVPSRVGAEAGGAADGGILALNLPVKHGLCGGIAADFFIGQECDHAFLQGSKAAFDLALGLGAGGDQMGDAQGGEGALELRAGIAVIRHGVMAKEAQSIGIDGHGDMVPEKENAKVLKVVPGSVGGDEDCAQEFARMVVNGEQQGLLVISGPPLVDGGIMLPEFADARAFPSSPGFGVWYGLGDEVGKVGSGKGGNGLAVALETEACFQFIGHELKVGRLLNGQELLEEGDGCRRPLRPMVPTREFGGEIGVFLEEAGAEPVKVGATDLEVVGGISGVNPTLVELPEDLLEKRVGQAICFF
jgi:hypothetical protein